MIREILIYGSLWNIFVFVLYGIDKGRAVRGKWRISEKTLLLLTLCGAGIGAFLGGNYFHHKTRKWYFQVIWYLGIIIQIAICYVIWKVRK